MQYVRTSIESFIAVAVLLSGACTGTDNNAGPEDQSTTDSGRASVSFLSGTTTITSTTDGLADHARVKFPSNVVDRGNFVLDTGNNTFAETGDPTLVLGYNMSSHGRQFLKSENSLGWFIEADYNNGSDRLMEIYTQYLSADAATVKRPLFFQFNRATDRLSNSVIMGNPLNVTDDLGNSSLELSPNVALFKGDYLQSTSADWNIHNTGANGNIYVQSNGGGLYLNASSGTGSVDISSANGVTRLHGTTFIGEGGTTQVNNKMTVTDGLSYVSFVASGAINYIQSASTTAPGSTAELRFTNAAAQDTWAKFDTSGNFVSYKQMTLGDSGPSWSTGTGSPEGIIAAPVGSLYSRTDGGPGSTLYVKESGTGTTGWAAK